MMLRMSANDLGLHRYWPARTGSGWAYWLMLAVGCSSPLHGGGSKDAGGSAGVTGDASDGPTHYGGNTGGRGLPGFGGASLTGGVAGTGAVAGTGGTVGVGGTSVSGGNSGGGGLVGSGGAARAGGGGGTTGVGGAGGRTATAGSGGNTGHGGLPGSGGVARTGGVSGTGGMAGTGGSAGAGGTPGSGGAGGTGGAAGSSGVFGMPCAANDDCPSDAICCNGSDPGCDGTRLPSGDGGTPGELVVSADGLTVTDTIAGLVWQLDVSSPRSGCTGSTPYECTWEEARAYCASLVLGGLSGWRVPGPIEILTLLDLAAVNGSRDPNGFPDSVDGDWTSASSADYGATPADHGLYLDTYYDKLIYCDPVPTNAVRCVRGSRCYPKSRFVVLDGGLVRDALTGLLWQEQTSTTTMTWADAQSYCSSLGTGFRLPTFRELVSLLWLSSDVTTPFSGEVPGAFWTSTPHEGPAGESSGHALSGEFFSWDGNSCESANFSSYTVSAALRVRCVR
jgi:hypothetical protein